MEEEKRKVNWRAIAIMVLVSFVIVTVISATVLFLLTYEKEYNLEVTIVSIDQENKHLVVEHCNEAGHCGIVVIQATDNVLATATYFQLEGERATLLVDKNGDKPDIVVNITSFSDGR